MNEHISKEATFFHVIQHANGDDQLFMEERNFEFFLGKMKKILLPEAELYAYCLMQNHLHLLISPKSDQKKCFQAISNLFNSYAKSFNILYQRKGSLFIKHFKLVPLETVSDLKRTIRYIHRNPIHHDATAYYHVYEWTSYNQVVEGKSDYVSVNKLYSLFGGKDGFIKEHEDYKS